MTSFQHILTIDHYYHYPLKYTKNIENKRRTKFQKPRPKKGPHEETSKEGMIMIHFAKKRSKVVELEEKGNGMM